jgi:hypothetical protein
MSPITSNQMDSDVQTSESDNTWIGKFRLPGGLALNLGGTRRSAASNQLMFGTCTHFSELDQPNVHTYVNFRLPFFLSGIPDSIRFADGVIHMTGEDHPASISAYNIGLADINPKLESLCVTPDNWGYTGHTKATVEFERFVSLSPHVDGGGQRANAADRAGVRARLNSVINSLVAESCRAINAVLDDYALITGNYGVPRISRNDLVRIDIWQSSTQPPVSPELRNFIAVLSPPGTALSIERQQLPSEVDVAVELESRSKLDDTYKLAYRSYVQAQRSLMRDDAPSAVIHATTAIEITVNHFIAIMRQQCAQSEPLSRISNSALEDCKDNLTLSLLLQVLLPLAVPAAERYPKEDADACNRLRKMRNVAVHDHGVFDSKYKNVDIKGDLLRLKKFLDFLTSVRM